MKLADDYLLLMAEKAELAKREKALKERLIKTGKPVVEGKLARITISRCSGSTRLDAKKVREVLTGSAFDQCLKPTASGWRFQAKARVI